MGVRPDTYSHGRMRLRNTSLDSHDAVLGRRRLNWALSPEGQTRQESGNFRTADSSHRASSVAIVSFRFQRGETEKREHGFPPAPSIAAHVPRFLRLQAVGDCCLRGNHRGPTGRAPNLLKRSRC